MKSQHVYDKAKYHHGSIQEFGLGDEHAANHTVVILRWLIENNLMSEFFIRESGDILDKFRAGKATIHQVYERWDCCLLEEMLSDEGNTFAMSYFDFELGPYVNEYATELQADLPSVFHIAYTEDNYQKMRRIIDRRYGEWKSPKKRWWFF